MDKANVSVLMPVYQGMRFLESSIESILHQSYSEFQLIIVDDGSTDDSLLIAKAYAERDSRISVYSQPHSGVVDTLNFARRQSACRYLALLDQDDVASPSRLMDEVTFLDANPQIAVVGSYAERIDEQGTRIDFLRRPTAAEGLTFHSMLEENLVIDASAMMRATVFDEVGGYRKLTFPGAHDYDLWLRISRLHPIDTLALPLVSLRIHLEQGSFSSLVDQVLAAAEARSIASIDLRVPLLVREQLLRTAESAHRAPHVGPLVDAVLLAYLEYASFYHQLGRMSALELVFRALGTYCEQHQCYGPLTRLVGTPAFTHLRRSATSLMTTLQLFDEWDA